MLIGVLLKVYTPPNAAKVGCHIYDEKTGKSSHALQCHYYSELGVKISQVGCGDLHGHHGCDVVEDAQEVGF